jgi:hypothetical protein
MSVKAPPDAFVQPERAAKHAQRRRRRVLGTILVIAVAVGVGVYAWLGSGGSGPPATSAANDAGAPAGAGPSMLAFQITGATTPSLAIVGAAADGTSAVVPVRPDLTIVVPGQGETVTGDVADLPGASMRVALSNMAGTWLDHYAVMDLADLATVVDRAGGIQVTLSHAYPTRSGPLGPGVLTLSGSQAKALLAGSTDDGPERWEIVLTSLLRASPEIEAADLEETDDADAAIGVIADAREADVLEIPTSQVAGTVIVPQYESLDRLMADSFGTALPTPVIVQNGNGEPGIGEAVGAALIPEGFRVALSQNAQSFDIGSTDVFANGVTNEAAARRARRALGVGRVRVSQVPSGIGDITIVVGKDFTVEGT